MTSVRLCRRPKEMLPKSCSANFKVPPVFSHRSLSPEEQLVLAVAQGSDAEPLIESLVHQVTDWSFVEEQLVKHSLAPRAEPLFRARHERIPATILQLVDASKRRAAAANITGTQQLLRVVRALEAEGIPVIPFKGPTLAQWAYGDVSLRRFGDLDILVPRERVAHAAVLLEGEGYTAYRSFDNGAARDAFIDSQMGWEFVDRDRNSVVELHWNFFFSIYPFALTPNRVWARHVRRSTWGHPIRAMHPVDMLLYLCYHGVKHRYASLKWLVDVQAWIAAHPSLNWADVLSAAEAARCQRAVHVSLLLTAELLQLPVPPPVKDALWADTRAQGLARQIVDGWLFAPLSQQSTEVVEDIWFHVRSCDRLADSWPFVAHYLGLFWKSKVADSADTREG